MFSGCGPKKRRSSPVRKPAIYEFTFPNGQVGRFSSMLVQADTVSIGVYPAFGIRGLWKAAGVALRVVEIDGRRRPVYYEHRDGRPAQDNGQTVVIGRRVKP